MVERLIQWNATYMYMLSSWTCLCLLVAERAELMMSAVSDADYVCTLNENSLKKAKDELKEDPKNRLGAVQKFRELVLQQPHIKCPTGWLYAACGRFCNCYNLGDKSASCNCVENEKD